VIQRSAVFRQPQDGIHVSGSTALIESTLVRQSALALGHDDAVSCTRDSDVTIRHSVIADSRHFGLAVSGGTTLLEESAVRGVTPSIDGGYCIASRPASESVLPPTALTIRSSEIADCVGVGVRFDADLTIETSLIHDVATLPDGTFGDGVAIVGWTMQPAKATVTGLLVEGVPRAGISAFGGHVDIGFASISCAQFDLVAEEVLGQKAAFERLAENTCGCPEATELCQVQSPGLAPPPGG
jgi:hypothetical protein